MPETIILNAEEKMQKSLEALTKSFSTIRTGKANPAVLNNVMVSYYGVMTPINQVGSVTAPDPQQIVVKPWDRSIIKDVAKAIQTANLGLNPLADAELIRIPIAPLTEDIRRNLVKDAKKIAEENKVAIRNVRRDAMEQLKKLEKDSLISEDELKIYSDEVQEATDKYVAKVDEALSAKEKDIMSI